MIDLAVLRDIEPQVLKSPISTSTPLTICGVRYPRLRFPRRAKRMKCCLWIAALKTHCWRAVCRCCQNLS